MAADTFDPAWRIDPTLTEFLHAFLFWARPASIVEFGSGASTLLFADHVRLYGGEVTSYEQSWHYHGVTQKMLALEALYAKVHHAAAVNGWYDEQVVERTIPDIIDFALVDGPGPCLGRTREPAMKWIYPRLSDTGLVVLDDGRRDMEKLYVKHWKEQYPDLDVTYLDSGHGAYLIRKGR